MQNSIFVSNIQSLEKYIYCRIPANFYFVSTNEASENKFTAGFVQNSILFQTTMLQKIYLMHDSCKIQFLFQTSKAWKNIFTAGFLQISILFQTTKPRKINILQDSCKFLFCFKQQSLG